MKKITFFTVYLLIFTTFSLVAQNQVVVPNSLENVTTTGTFLGPLANSARTYQLLINESELTELLGKELSGISFRSTASTSTTWPDSQVTYSSYDIFLGPSVAPVDRSLNLPSNFSGTQTQVRSGSLVIEPNSYPVGGAQNFGSEISFDMSYLYTGGHLLLEIKHQGSNGGSKSVEAVLTSNALYWTTVSAAWASSTTATAGNQGNAAVVRFSYIDSDTEVTSVEVTTQGDIPAEITIEGGTLQLEAVVNPSGVSQQVTWTVQNGTGVVSVDSNGLVTAIINGTATVRATSVADNTKYDEIDVLVDIPVSVEISTEGDVPAEILIEGTTLQLVAEVTPSFLVQDVVWSVEDGQDVIIVSEDGLVAAIGNGTAIVRATSVEDITVYDEINILVAIPVSVEITIEGDSPAEITTSGGTLQLMAEITPSFLVQDVVWSVEIGAEIVSVNDLGLVTGLSDGEAIIRATSVNEDTIYDEIVITVTNQLSIESNEISSLVYYPNPVKDKLFISNERFITNVEIYNYLGQKVFDKQINSETADIDLSFLSSGSYIVKADGEYFVKSFQIIKQ